LNSFYSQIQLFLKVEEKEEEEEEEKEEEEGRR